MMQKTAKGLHPRNLHNARYDFDLLIKSEPKLAPFVGENSYGNLSIDFADPKAVVMLNKALLSHFYAVAKWTIPENYLCPPIPGRADYIHYLADLLASVNGGEIPVGEKVAGLDIGVGANCIYPIVGSRVYGWRFVGSDIDKVSIKSAVSLVANNSVLQGRIEIREQTNPDNIFTGIIGKEERFDFTLCNPPFHRSPQEASRGTARKNRNLGTDKESRERLNFGGQANELWCPGGEVAFIKKMIRQSVVHAKKVLWFTTLVSKKENLPAIYKALKQLNPAEVRTVEMKQGQKVARFVAWTFLSPPQQKAWQKERW